MPPRTRSQTSKKTSIPPKKPTSIKAIQKKSTKRQQETEKLDALQKQLETVQSEVLQLEQQARVLCTVVVRCENKLIPFMTPEHIRNMSVEEYEQAHSELQEMMFDCRIIMDKISAEKSHLLELINALELEGEDKKDLIKSLESY